MFVLSVDVRLVGLVHTCVVITSFASLFSG